MVALAFLSLLAAPATLEVTVDGVKRTGIVYASGKSGAAVVFAFHGHGGSARQAARSFRLHEEWPEAVAVYLQGLPGVAGITDADGSKAGWQKDPKTYGDRDLKFFDAALAKVKGDYSVDPKRIYAMGHSNGSRFVNVLWNQRGSVFAAFGCVAGQGGLMIRTDKPKSVFVVAGEKDPLVPYRSQMLSVDAIRRLLRVDATKNKASGYLTTEQGANGYELVTFLHPGGHEFPKSVTKLMVDFFKRHSLK